FQPAFYSFGLGAYRSPIQRQDVGVCTVRSGLVAVRFLDDAKHDREYEFRGPWLWRGLHSYSTSPVWFEFQGRRLAFSSVRTRARHRRAGLWRLACECGRPIGIWRAARDGFAATRNSGARGASVAIGQG